MLPRYCLKLFTPEKKIFHKIRNFTNITDPILKEAAGKRTKVQGWVKAMRKMKENIFIDVNDGSTYQHMQVVIKKSDAPNNLTYGSCVTVEGTVQYAPNGRVEIKSEEIFVLGDCDIEDGVYPFLPRKQYSEDYIRQYLHLRMRTRQFSAVLRMRDLTSFAIAEHMRNRGFINIHTPIITSNDCEGAGEVFTIKPESKKITEDMRKDDQQTHESIYFDTKAYLTVSGQLHLETMARALSKVYTFGPTFRAENSRTRLHLSEFYMLEAEQAFITDIKEIATEIELLVKQVTATVVDKGKTDLEALNSKIPNWLERDFLYLPYNDAIDILNRHSKELNVPVRPHEGLSRDHELFLVQHFDNTPIFVVDFPTDLKPFYMKEYHNDTSKVAALDLLMPLVGELVGGSLREDNYDKLKKKIPSSDLSWYLELRKYGNVPTGGFGMGFERYLQVILGIPNIRDVIPFPRWPHNCSL